ncbi:MAG: alanine--tRNA ligase [Rhodothermales bacterium]
MPVTYTSEQIREAFFTFFARHGHEIVPSDSLVPKNDPTLMFTNAGMNQFKDVFLGTGDRPYKRAADTQKVLRVSGKHNDLEEVGYDTYHHTFFEMLGNWSFGDYFKKEAVRWAWELLVGEWGLEADRLYATVHGGDDRLGLAPDEEAAAVWRTETSIDPDHILFCGSKDNFWMMGDTGPCGPCSEVHIDLRPDAERAKIPGKTLVNADDPRVMEIWNLVFIQYNAQTDGSLQPLPAKHVDTGMGFERVVAVMQGKQSTYDTDLFAPLLAHVARLSPIEAIKGYDQIEGVDEAQRERYRIAMRVVVDHIRTCAFAIADGVSPGNAGRGYVIRRILRRAVRYGYQTLGLREPFLHALVTTLIGKMGAAFPELRDQQDYIERVIRAEEESFLETLGTGLVFFERLMPYIEGFAAGRAESEKKRLLADHSTLDLLGKGYDVQDRDTMVDRFAEVAGKGLLPGEIAFLLHDTYGFPIDLTELMLREVGHGVDMTRYQALMTVQKDRARAATSFKVDQSKADVWQLVGESVEESFTGYDTLEEAGARVTAYRTVTAGDVEQHQVVLDRTPFYAESGGQIGDTGTLVLDGDTVQVLDTQKLLGRVVHIVDRLPDDLTAEVRAMVDADRREEIKKHHSATHLLHAALREELGAHVAQKGSLVAPDRLRFDFSHYERVTPEQLRRVEARVNAMIQRNIPRREERSVPVDEALSRGAMALFGEKYGDFVRMITFDPAYSIELCGGTHVDATGELGVFRFVSEGSVAAGVRRVEAVVGKAALDYIEARFSELDRVRGLFKVPGESVDEAVAALQAEQRRLEKELEQVNQQQLAGRLDAFIGSARQVGAARLVTGRVDNVDMEALRTLGQTLRDRLEGGSVAVLGGVDPAGDKAYLVATVSDDLLASTKVKAGALVGALAQKVGGGGGGKPQLATAGGRHPEKLDEALASVADVLAGML